MWIYGEYEHLLKLSMLAVAFVLAQRFSARKSASVRSWKQRFRSLANQPWKCAAILFLLSIGLNLLLYASRPTLPWIHDEYSYLLASETFADGRMTNPTHPMWEHFESFHVLSQPSYMSKYPPANAMFMALGQVIFGMPIAGVWFALALASVATFWMLRAWTTPIWALWGGLIVTTNGWLLSAWGQSYWGGAVAFLAGALLFGGVRRITTGAQIRDALLFGAGLILVANSRPMEGFLISLPLSVVLIWWLATSSEFTFARKFSRAFVPVMMVGLFGLAAMGTYNKSVTGSYTDLPYKLHDQNYSASSLLIWQPSPEIPQYNHDRMATYYVDCARQRQIQLREPTNYVANLQRKFHLVWAFFTVAMGIALMGFPTLWKDKWNRLALVTVGGLLLIHSQLATSYMFPHYLAPLTAIFIALSVQSLRHIRTWKREMNWGVAIVRFALIFAMLKLVPVGFAYQKELRLHPRETVERQLKSDPAMDLVIVSYAANYNINDEWVYNSADIDGSPIVWARDMGPEKNARLLEHFAGRKIWRWHLETDDSMVLQECNELGIALTEYTLIGTEFVRSEAITPGDPNTPRSRNLVGK